MEKEKIESLADRLAHLHRKLKSVKKLHGKHTFASDIHTDIQSELTALRLELRIVPKTDGDKPMFLKLCSDLQTIIVDYETLKDTLEKLNNVDPQTVPSDSEIPKIEVSQESALPSPKQIENIDEVILREKCAEIENLARELCQLHELEIDMAEVVGEQQHSLYEIERQVEVTAVETVKTEIELEQVTLTQASAYYCSYQRKKWCAIGALLCGLVLVGTVLAVLGAVFLRK